jgi:hypothetical protein
MLNFITVPGIITGAIMAGEAFPHKFCVNKALFLVNNLKLLGLVYLAVILFIH